MFDMMDCDTYTFDGTYRWKCHIVVDDELTPCFPEDRDAPYLYEYSNDDASGLICTKNTAVERIDIGYQ